MAAPYQEYAQQIAQLEEGKAGSGAATPLQPAQPAKGFRERVWYTACHDPFTFCYLLAAPFAFVWYIIGLGGGGELDDCEDQQTAVFVVAGLGMLYLFGTIFVALASCCWEGVRLAQLRDHASDSAAPPWGAGAPAGPGGPPGHFMSHIVAPNFTNQAYEPPVAPAIAPPYATSQDPSGAGPAPPAPPPPYAAASAPGGYGGYPPPPGAGTAPPPQPQQQQQQQQQQPEGVYAKMKHAFGR